MKYREDKYKERVKFGWDYYKRDNGKYNMYNFIPKHIDNNGFLRQNMIKFLKIIGEIYETFKIKSTYN